MNPGNVNDNSGIMSNEWTENERQIQDRPSDFEETSAFEPDDESKIKPEVELKEETDGFIYKADFRGHLQLVSLNSSVHNQCSIPKSNQSGDDLAKHPSITPVNNSTYEESDKHYNEEPSSQPVNGCRMSDIHGEWERMKSILPTTNEAPQAIVAWEEETEHSNNNHVYRQLKNMSDDSVEENYFIKEEPTENSSQECSYVHTLPEIYDYSSDSTWEQQFAKSSQELDMELHKSLSRNGNSILLTQAEKKRLYRMRIKEENPTMWSTIKKREAARKREQREKRRHILFEMQRAMEFAALPNSPEMENHKLYLEALKERYPELWNQLVNALPETQMRNEQVYNERNPKSRRQLPKPAKLYKDVIEAQKKRIYRQRIKEERPEMYARQKARDAYARSMQRLMMKKKSPAEKNEFNIGSFSQNDIERKLTYLQNLQVEHIHYMGDERMNSHFPNEVNPVNANSSISETSLPSVNSSTKSDPSQVCDNSEDSYNISKNSANDISKISKTGSESSISDGDITKEGHEMSNPTFPKSLSVAAACSTQSDILWYWNDVRGNQCTENLEVIPRVPYAPSRRTPQVLTEEERLQKILKERMQLKEKRRRYRMNMSPEKRSEFLEVERERLKAYRLKKKVASLTMESTIQNEMICVDQ